MRKIIVLTFAFTTLLITLYAHSQNIVVATPTSEAHLVESANPDADAPHGDAEHGAELFKKGANGAPPCAACHSARPEGSAFPVGPTLFGVPERAATRVEGLSAHEYMHQSIVDPGSFVVNGFRNIMFKNFADKYSEQDIQDVIAYLETLH